MHLQILILSVVAAGCYADYHNEFTRPSYVTPSPSPSYLATAEPKAYSEDDRRPYSDGPGPSHPRTGPPPKKLGPGPGPGLSYTSGGVPLTYPQRLLPAGSIIGYLAYPQPLAPLHDAAPATPGLLPSAAFSHIAYAAPVPVPLQHYRPVLPGPGPTYNSGPSFSSGPSYPSYNH